MNCFLFVVVFTVLLSACVASAGKRVTRIINGELVVGRTTGYDVVRYYAAIGTLHGEAAFGVSLFGIKRNFGLLTCGGALITPGIVQTACHCLSHKQEPDKHGRLLPAIVKHDWEYIIRVYIGVNKQFGEKWSMAKVAPLIAKKFMVHQSCAKLPKGTLELPTHDYGWIVIDPDWDPNVQYAGRVNYAPLYTEEELLDTWDYLDARQAVCLVVGFGPTVEGVRPKNKKMRHGWLNLLSRWKCVLRTSKGASPQSGLLTWVCLVPFSKHYQSPARGDSGSPLTCNNRYLAVVSGVVPVKARQEDEEIKKFVSIDDALYFAKYQNTKEFRRDFMRFMEAYGNIIEDITLHRTDKKASSSQMLHAAAKYRHMSYSTSSRNSNLYSTIWAFILIPTDLIKHFKM